MEALTTGLFLAVVNQKVVDYLIAPVKQKWPEIDLWFALYIALATGFAIGWLSGANFFEAYMPDETIGRVLSSILVGGGSSLIHDIFDVE